MPVPTAVLKREDSRRKSGGILVKEGLISNKKQVKKGKRERSGFWRRFFRSFLVACRECHAMEPSTRDDMLQENIKLWLIRIWPRASFFLWGYWFCTWFDSHFWLNFLLPVVYVIILQNVALSQGECFPDRSQENIIIGNLSSDLSVVCWFANDHCN